MTPKPQFEDTSFSGEFEDFDSEIKKWFPHQHQELIVTTRN